MECRYPGYLDTTKHQKEEGKQTSDVRSYPNHQRAICQCWHLGPRKKIGSMCMAWTAKGGVRGTGVGEGNGSWKCWVSNTKPANLFTGIHSVGYLALNWKTSWVISFQQDSQTMKYYSLQTKFNKGQHNKGNNKGENSVMIFFFIGA